MVSAIIRATVRIAFRLVGDLAAADDAAIGVFLKLYRNPLPGNKQHNVAGFTDQ